MSPLFRRHKEEEDPFGSLAPPSEDPFAALEDREGDVEVHPAGGGGRSGPVAFAVVLALFLLIAGGAVAAVLAISEGGDDGGADGPQVPAFTVAPQPAPGPAPAGPSPSPSPSPEPTPARPSPPRGSGGSERGSLVRAAAFRRALARLPRGAKLINLRLAPERLDAQLLRGGRLANIQVRGNDVNEISVSGSGFGALPTYPVSRVDPAAPDRMIRSARVRASQVNYLVFTGATKPARWLLYLSNGRFYQGGPDGRGAKRVGG